MIYVDGFFFQECTFSQFLYAKYSLFFRSHIHKFHWLLPYESFALCCNILFICLFTFSEVTFSSSVRKKHKQPASEIHLFEQSINEQKFSPSFVFLSFVWLDVKICKYQISLNEECPDSPFICFLCRNGPSLWRLVVMKKGSLCLISVFKRLSFWVYCWWKFINDVKCDVS